MVAHQRKYNLMENMCMDSEIGDLIILRFLYLAL